MSTNPRIQILQQFLAQAQAEVPNAQKAIEFLNGQIDQCNQQIEEIQNRLNYNKLAIDGRRSQIRQEEAAIGRLQEEYSRLIDQSANADENELESIRARIVQARSEAEQHQANVAQLQEQIRELEGQKAALEQEMRAVHDQLTQAKANLKQFQAQCKEMASHVGRYMAAAKSEASKYYVQGESFGRLSSYRYGSSEARNVSQQEYEYGRQCNSLANQLDQVARTFRALASSGSSDRSREIER